MSGWLLRSVGSGSVFVFTFGWPTCPLWRFSLVVDGNVVLLLFWFASGLGSLWFLVWRGVSVFGVVLLFFGCGPVSVVLGVVSFVLSPVLLLLSWSSLVYPVITVDYL